MTSAQASGAGVAVAVGVDVGDDVGVAHGGEMPHGGGGVGVGHGGDVVTPHGGGDCGVGHGVSGGLIAGGDSGHGAGLQLSAGGMQRMRSVASILPASTWTNVAPYPPLLSGYAYVIAYPSEVVATPLVTYPCDIMK